MKKANILLDDQSSGLTIIEKMDFEYIDAFHDAICYAFHPNGIGEDEPLDDRFMALWTIFLYSVGWTEEEFWEEYRIHFPRKCEKCAADGVTDETSKYDADAPKSSDPKDVN